VQAAQRFEWAGELPTTTATAVGLSQSKITVPTALVKMKKRGASMTRGMFGLESEARSWQSKANCMGVDPELFFPERGASTREAKEVCRGCIVREDCLEYALANGEKFGIWGGLSERERRKVRRSRALARRANATASA
jgi:WhiB family transcriptional regulator, redox-sensing transcriptional regulator